MALKRLLCIAPGGPGTLACHGIALPHWDVCCVAGLREAARALRTATYPVGLLVDSIDPANHAELALFLRAQADMQWLGVCAPAVLEARACRDLIADHLWDFHTEPVDPARLAAALGHAHGCALLRQAPPAAGAAAAPMMLTGHSEAIVRLRAQIRKVASVNAPVLIWGESGSGKEVTAQAIHASSARAHGPFVPINCGAMPASLIQSELFGHARGAFTGAARDKPGLIETAQGGTIFLDEIADLPRELQSNLLRFLQEKTLYRLGSTRSIEVDARVVAASHVRLQKAVARGAFREDLYYRLNVLPIDVPPLRERRPDLALLAQHFFTTYASERSPRLRGFSNSALRAIAEHPWPGNVRELINRTRRAMVMAEGRLIGPDDLGLGMQAQRADGETLAAARVRAERAAICASLERGGPNITRAARELGVSRMTLYRLLDKHGIAS
ncbi:MAG: sigma 54-interacting transcriptional regulator [Pseudomonadota bacterium]